jgi:intein/homing endonuclease
MPGAQSPISPWYEPVPVWDAAYYAGLFDGEGCVMIKMSRCRGREYHTLRVDLSNTHLGVLEELQSVFGGSVSQGDKRRRQCWYWHLSVNDAYRFLLTIQPFARIKAEQIVLALEFRKLTDAYRSRGTTGPRRLDSVAVALREELRLRVQELKRTG